MCGIAGLAGPDAARHQTTVWAMGMSQSYRGPDGTLQAASPDGRAVLAMNTLMIVDPAAHPGPYLDAGSGLLLAFNGEIYNFRQQAAAWGIPLADRETDAHLAKLGAACLDGLDGMFALALYDPNAGEAGRLCSWPGTGWARSHSTGAWTAAGSRSPPRSPP
ncbi:hypothetical protein ACWCZ5_34310 [Streptomyces sp. NPDC001667]